MGKVRDTSLRAYIGINEDGTAATKRAKVYNEVKRSSGTRSEIAVRSGIPINAVCGRVKELLDAGALYERGEVHCKVTGHKAMLLTSIAQDLSTPIEVKAKKPSRKLTDEEVKQLEADNARLRKHSEFLEWQIASMDAFMTFKYPYIAGILETACGAREVLEKCKEARLKENDNGGEG